MEQNTLIKTLEVLTQGMGRGMVFVREDGTIGACNQMMQELLGIIFSHGRSHEEGRLIPGDIVIIADNEIGGDDKLSPEDLTTLDIHDSGISKGDALLVIGAYKQKNTQKVYKFISGNGPERRIDLSAKYAGNTISAAIDFSCNLTSITVNGDTYTMSYQEAIGNMMILDGKDGHVKFFQDFGYDLRGEEIGELLRGQG